MAAEPCPKCGELRKVDVVWTSDGWAQPECYSCGDPGYLEPHEDRVEFQTIASKASAVRLGPRDVEFPPRDLTGDETTETLMAAIHLSLKAAYDEHMAEVSHQILWGDGMGPSGITSDAMEPTEPRGRDLWAPILQPSAFVNLTADDVTGAVPPGTVPVVARTEETFGLNVERNQYMFRVSREYAVAFGLVEPNDAERAAMAAESALLAERVARVRVEFQTLVEHLAHPTRPALRAVIDLHAPHRSEYDSRLTCRGCPSGEDWADWPCSTIEAIAKVCGWPCPDPWLIPADVIPVSDVDANE